MADFFKSVGDDISHGVKAAGHAAAAGFDYVTMRPDDADAELDEAGANMKYLADKGTKKKSKKFVPKEVPFTKQTLKYHHDAGLDQTVAQKKAQSAKQYNMNMGVIHNANTSHAMHNYMHDYNLLLKQGMASGAVYKSLQDPKTITDTQTAQSMVKDPVAMDLLRSSHLDNYNTQNRHTGPTSLNKLPLPRHDLPHGNYY